MELNIDNSEELLFISLLTFYILRDKESRKIVKRLAAFRSTKGPAKRSLVPHTTKYSLADVMFQRKKEFVKCHEEICQIIAKIQTQDSYFKLQPTIVFSQTLFECVGFSLYLLCGEIINLVYGCIFQDMASLCKLTKEERIAKFTTILNNKEIYQHEKIKQLSHLLAHIINPEELRIHEVIKILKQSSKKMERWLEEKNAEKISSVHSIIINSSLPGWNLSQPPLEVCFQVVQKLLNDLVTYDLPESNCQSLLNIILTEEFFNFLFPNLLLATSQSFVEIDQIMKKKGEEESMFFEKGIDHLNELRAEVWLSLVGGLPDYIQIYEEKIEWAEVYCREAFEKCWKKILLENEDYKIPEQIILYAKKQCERRCSLPPSKKKIDTSQNINIFQRQFFKLSSHRDSLGRAMLLRPGLSFPELKKHTEFLRRYMLKIFLLFKLSCLPSSKIFFSFLHSIALTNESVENAEKPSPPVFPVELKYIKTKKDSTQYLISWIKPNGYLYGELIMHLNYFTFIRYKNEKKYKGCPPYPENKGRIVYFVNYKDITSVFEKRFALIRRALELYLRNGKSMFLVFSRQEYQKNFLKKTTKIYFEKRKYTVS